MNPRFLLVCLALVYTPSSILAHGKQKPRADSHAPIGVMGDHLHKKGKWMFSYRYMNMQMDGMLSGKDSVSAEQIALTANPLAAESMRMGDLANGLPRLMTVPPTYRVSPVDMSMEMHMIGGMYGWNNNISLMLMLPVIQNKMTLLSYGGSSGINAIGTFNGDTSGLGDVNLSALIKYSDEGNQKSHFTLGISIPTGSTTKKGKILPPFAGVMTPAGETVEIDRLGYSMQLGSGSYDLLSGFTLYDRVDNLGWGSQISTVIRLDRNEEGYRLGNRLEAQLWLTCQWRSWISSSVKIKAFSQGKISGRDDIITGGMPLFVSSHSGREQIELGIGLNLLGEDSLWEGHRLGLEFAVPIYQNVNGLQMKSDWNLILGWQKAL